MKLLWCLWLWFWPFVLLAIALGKQNFPDQRSGSCSDASLFGVRCNRLGVAVARRHAG